MANINIDQLAAVTTWLYERLPAIAKFIFTTKQIDIMIESAVTRMKEYLKNNTSFGPSSEGLFFISAKKFLKFFHRTLEGPCLKGLRLWVI